MLLRLGKVLLIPEILQIATELIIRRYVFNKPLRFSSALQSRHHPEGHCHKWWGQTRAWNPLIFSVTESGRSDVLETGNNKQHPEQSFFQLSKLPTATHCFNTTLPGYSNIIWKSGWNIAYCATIYTTDINMMHTVGTTSLTALVKVLVLHTFFAI